MSNALREKLADIALEGIDAVHDMDVTHDAYAWSIADKLIAALPGMVKPLEWVVETSRGVNYHRAGGMTIKEVDKSQLEAAKAAAQTHYTNTILSALGVTDAE